MTVADGRSDSEELAPTIRGPVGLQLASGLTLDLITPKPTRSVHLLDQPQAELLKDKVDFSPGVRGEPRGDTPNNVDSLTRLHALSLRSVSAKGAHSYDGGPSAAAGHDDGYHATNWTQRSGPVGRPTPGVEANDPRLETPGD